MNKSPFSVVIGSITAGILGYFIITTASSSFTKIVLTLGLLSGIEILSRGNNDNHYM